MLLASKGEALTSKKSIKQHFDEMNEILSSKQETSIRPHVRTVFQHQMPPRRRDLARSLTIVLNRCKTGKTCKQVVFDLSEPLHFDVRAGVDALRVAHISWLFLKNHPNCQACCQDSSSCRTPSHCDFHFLKLIFILK